jgi:hypothetical protein
MPLERLPAIWSNDPDPRPETMGIPGDLARAIDDDLDGSASALKIVRAYLPGVHWSALFFRRCR